MNSRERMLAAITGGTPDRVPLSFMIFNALRARSDDWRDFTDRAVALGLDPVVDLIGIVPNGGAEHSDCPGPPVHFAPGVVTREWRTRERDARYSVLHKEYVTPDGTLTVAVNRTDDWRFGDHVPFLNDYIEPRATKHLVTSPDDLPALRHLLVEPTAADLVEFREACREAKTFATKRQLLLSGGWGIGADALAWLFGLTDAVLAAVDRPDFLDDLLDILHRWNLRRMSLMLEAGLDLFIRRGWYEGTSFWSPTLYRRFILPRVKAEAALAHEAGAKFGYIMTVGANPFADLLVEADVDVVIGVEDVQDHGMDFAALKRKTRGKLALWGGVNGFLHIEEGGADDIRAATVRALDTLGPDGFILSPVDNIRNTSEDVWQRVLFFIETWKDLVNDG
ncbi:MAG TPA: uroporphyrinogen decarboxylase family protein [Planctomycetota bacterium]|nr:uroporphyrinogen decarboxylase family protein [Planctomycetota bacterium]